MSNFANSTVSPEVTRHANAANDDAANDDNGGTHLHPEKLKDIILNKLNCPLVMKGYLKKLNIRGNWQCLLWTKEYWTTLLRENILEVRFGKRLLENEKLAGPEWESSSLKGKMSYNELLNFENGVQPVQTTCGKEISCKQFWAYFDYYYMKNLTDTELANRIVSWKDFGFSELKASDSTLWIGTSGAYTPCHIDTYGCNIVCQIYGKKHWTLFPKDQSKLLYATRIPYEESSIYSKVGFPRPDMTKFPLANSATPFMVTLEAGDVLLVPKHWWHFVEAVDFSISINTWISLCSDYEDRVKETIVMYQIGSLCQSITSPPLLAHIFNPNMMDVAMLTSSELLELIVEKLTGSRNCITDKSRENKTNINPSQNNKTDIADSVMHSELAIYNIYPLKQCSFTDYLNYKNMKSEFNIPLLSNNSSIKKDDIFEFIVESFTDDRVIGVIKQILEEKFQNYDRPNT